MPEKSKLYLLPVPIAPDTLHLLPPQVGTLVEALGYFLVENERTARRFIGSLKKGIEIRDIHFYVVDKKTSVEQLSKIFSQIPQGQSVGVMSEAGCPGIADPGALAVAYAHQIGWEVIPVPGPSAIFLALMASGMNGQGFAFNGYLPIPQPQRVNYILKMEKEAAKSGQTQIFMETPYRNEQLFRDLITNCQVNTRLCIAKDITGAEQEIKTLSIAEWRKLQPKLHKFPTVFLLSV